jgi:hypothetical protein
MLPFSLAMVVGGEGRPCVMVTVDGGVVIGLLLVLLLLLGMADE